MSQDICCIIAKLGKEITEIRDFMEKQNKLNAVQQLLNEEFLKQVKESRKSVNPTKNTYEEAVIKFVTRTFDTEYPVGSCPKWVNYEMFRNDMIPKLTKSVIESITDDYDDDTDHSTTAWNSLMHVPFYSRSYDPGQDCNWNNFYTLEIEIPEEVIKLVKESLDQE